MRRNGTEQRRKDGRKAKGGVKGLVRPAALARRRAKASER
jgi:hypothetical protein